MISWGHTHYILCMKHKVAIAADHGGINLKAAIKEKFADQFEFIDLGTDGPESVDYPDFGHKLAAMISAGDVEWGILICGSGIGISIAANREPKVRSALCVNTTMARLSRQHNDANVIALGERIIGTELAFDMIDIFFNTEFEGGRHARRVAKMS